MTTPCSHAARTLPSVYQLRVVVHGVSPLIWRRLLTHLHRFVVQGREYGIGYVGGPSFDADPRKVRLRDLGLQPTERFTYHYDCECSNYLAHFGRAIWRYPRPVTSLQRAYTATARTRQ